MLETVRGLPEFLLAVVLSLAIFAGIQRLLPRAEGPGLLPVYFCCAVLPAFALVFGIGAAIRSRAAEDRPLFTVTPIHVMLLGTVAVLACIALAAWPGPRQLPADAATRARDLARRAVVQRLSTAGVEGMQLDARQIFRDGTPYWRVTTSGALTNYVIDVGEGTRAGRFGEQEPVVDIFEVGAAPLEDVLTRDTAPVSSE